MMQGLDLPIGNVNKSLEMIESAADEIIKIANFRSLLEASTL